MKIAGLFPYSLKTRIILAVGGLIAVLMFVINVSLIFQWRHMIIQHEITNTRELARAFAIPALDALIFSENDNEYYEPYLRSQIQEFSDNVADLQYIMLTDNENRVIASSNITQYNQTVSDTVSHLLRNTAADVCMIYEHAQEGWVIEAAQPLRIAGKQWGNLRIAKDAEPIRAEINSLFFKLHGFTAVLILLALSVIYFLVGRMTNSLRSLVTDIDKIDLDSEEFIEKEISNDEIGTLTRHFRSLELRLSESRSQLLRAQSLVFQAEKLASVGRLASGVAHEINNPLNGIRNCLYSIRQDPENASLREEYFNLIDEGVYHIESVVKKLLGFARHSTPNKSAAQLNNVVESTHKLLAYQLDKKGVTIEMDLDPGLPEITADVELLREVIMNLLLNSYDAVPEGGRILIRTGRTDNETVFFSVEDNGEGIAPDQMSHIFDPFYTTKESQEGTGLGLSVSLGIVETHGGTFDVKSTPGESTVFIVNLPIEGDHERPAD